MKGWVYGITFAMGGDVCLTGSAAGQLQLWDTGRWDAPREEIDVVPAESRNLPGPYIMSLVTAPDGRSGVALGPSGTGRPGGKLHFWALSPLRVTTMPHVNGLLSGAFSPDGKLLATGDEKGTILLWDVASATVIQPPLDGHSAEVVGLAFTPDGRRLLSGSFDKTLRLWDVTARSTILRLTGHRGAVRDVRISPNGRIGASTSSDQTIKCWDLESGRELTTFSRHVQGALSVDFLPDGSGLVSSGEDGHVSAWSLATDDRMVLPLHPGGVSDVCIARDGLTALSAGMDGQIVQFDLATGKVLRRIKAPREVSAIDLAYDGRSALVGGSQGMLQSLSLVNFKLSPVRIRLDAPAALSPITTPAPQPATQPATQLASFRDAVSVVALSPTAASALVGGNDGLLALLPLPPRNGGVARRMSGRLMAAAFTPDGTRALIAVERDLYLIDPSSGDVMHVMPRSPRLIAAVAVAGDGKTAVTGSYDSTARLWNLEKRTMTKVLFGHDGWVRAVAFLPDGTVVTASQDNTVRLWDVQTSRELCTLAGHTAAVTALAVSPDGSVILSGSADGTIRKWDLSRPVTYRRMQGELANVHAALESRADDPAALAKLGEWYAFRGRDDWAVECLERARAGGAEVSPLMLARAYWKLGRAADAAREFDIAAARKEAPAAYLNLCQAALAETTGK